MRILFTAVLYAVYTLSCTAAYAQDWLHRPGALVRLEAETLAPLLPVAVGRVDAIASDGAGGVWVVTADAVTRLDAGGTASLRIPLRALGIAGRVTHLAVDPYAAQAWVSDGSRLIALDAAGRVRVRRPLPAAPLAIALAPDRHLWVMERGRVLRLRPDGSLVAAFDLRIALHGEARDLVPDDTSNRMWILGERRGILLDAAGAVLHRIAVSDSARDVCRIAGADQLWVLTASSLERRDAAGQLHGRLTLKSLGIGRAADIACNWSRQEVWVAHERGIVRISVDGAVVGTIAVPATQRIEPVAFSVLPATRLLQPPPDALTDDPRPLFELEVSATCAGGRCPTLTGYLDGMRVKARIDAQPVGVRVGVDAQAGRATYVADADLADGPHRFVAKLVDGFGRESPEVAATFTVDTTAPAFLAVSPDDGAVVTAAQVIVSGTVDDPQATVVLANQQALGASALSSAPGAFAFSVPLHPGINAFTLSAVDRAGNVRTRTLQVQRIVSQIGIVVAAPADGAKIQADSVIVRGTVEAGGQRVGVSVNGEPATLVGNAFHAQVPLQPGANVLEIRVTDMQGGVTTRTLSVTRQGIRAFRVDASPATGIAPAKVAFTVAALATQRAASLRIDYQGDGTFDLTTSNPNATFEYTYTTPGVYTARILVTDTTGFAEMHMVQVVVQALSALNQEIKAVLQSMLASLKAGNVNAAVAAFAPGVQPRYRNLFERAGANLPAAVDALGTVQDGSIFGAVAEFAMVQERPSGPKAYFVYLTKGRDGLWRIQQM